MVIGGGSKPFFKYICPLHRYRGVCSNKVYIRQDRLEEQLLAALASNLLGAHALDRILRTFAEQVHKRLREIESGSSCVKTDNELRGEMISLTSQQDKLVDAISSHGFSGALSDKLRAVESRRKEISDILSPKREPTRVTFSTEEISEFVLRKAQDFGSALRADPQNVKETLRRHIKELVLTPKETSTGWVYEVTGDLDLLGGDQSVMLTKSLNGIAQHYTPPGLAITNVVLDPNLPIAA